MNMDDLVFDIAKKEDISELIGFQSNPDIGYINEKVDMALYMSDGAELSENIPTDSRECIVASGDFPILQVGRDDEVIMYSASSVDDITIYGASFVGYTIPAFQSGEGVRVSYFPVIDHVYPNGINRENMGVFDLNEKPVSDVHDLEYGKSYKYEWYSGAEYNEVDLYANSRCYVRNPEETYTISSELTKNGYVTFDFSSFEPGIYSYGIGPLGETVFEIVE